MKIKQLISSRKRRMAAAFSLVETTVGLSIVATVGGAMMTGITSGYFTMQMARENSRATQIMLEKVETIRLYTFDQINNNNYNGTGLPFIPRSFTNYYDPNGVISHGLAYRGTMSITNAPFTATYGGNLKQVTVTLNWKTGNLDRTRTFQTLVAKDGLQNYIW
jgi:type II secretory pathway pseudopilin PulG